MSPMDLQVARYVDGELDADARRAFEQRLAADPDLAARVDAARGLSALFAGERAVAGPVARPGFRGRVLEACFADAATRTDGDGAERVVVWARRAIYAAAALVLCAVLARSGLFGRATDVELRAGPAEIQKMMEELDARTAARRADGR